MSNTGKRDAMVRVLLTAEEKREITAVAELADDSVSTLVRRLIKAHIRDRELAQYPRVAAVDYR